MLKRTRLRGRHDSNQTASGKSGAVQHPLDCPQWPSDTAALPNRVPASTPGLGGHSPKRRYPKRLRTKQEPHSSECFRRLRTGFALTALVSELRTLIRCLFQRPDRVLDVASCRGSWPYRPAPHAATSWKSDFRGRDRGRDRTLARGALCATLQRDRLGVARPQGAVPDDPRLHRARACCGQWHRCRVGALSDRRGGADGA
jgi:hypothetical protein